ncbi:MAG: SdrD B-like domain-containing protein [Thermoflexales bacterium]
MRTTIRLLIAGIGALIACQTLDRGAQADTYPVDDTTDLPDALVGNGVCATTAGTCSLRAAIQEANAHAGPDTVSLPAGTFVLTRTGPFENSAFTGDLDLRDTITVAGAGRGLTLIDGNLTDRVFEIFPAVTNAPMTATLSAFTIRRGGNVSTGCGMDIRNTQTRVFVSQVDIRDGACQASNGYGGIYFNGAYLLSLDDVVIDNNTGWNGGGLYHTGGRLFISGTLISNNTAQSNGGGGLAQNAFVSVNRSAFAGNRSASNGGGLYLFNVSGGITSTTIAGNYASSSGGGVYAYYASNVKFSWDTIARNRSGGTGGGAYAEYPGITLRGTLIDANTAVGAGPDAYCNASLVSQGNSLIGDITQCVARNEYSGGAGDVVNVKPGVGAVISMAGTQVVPLVYGSRAMDAGGVTCPAIDQRNQPRPADGNGDGLAICDIGAYETQSPYELSVSGMVYADSNRDGAWGPGIEAGVPGVTITLSDLGSGLIVTSSTASDGSFAFGALATGTFILREFQPAAFDDGVDALGTAGGVLGNDAMTVSLVAATPALSYTFGEYPFTVVSGTVYLDEDGNGAYDPQIDNGAFSVAMVLAGTTTTGQPVSMTANTDFYGRFAFFPVPPGVYTLTQTQPNNYFDGEEAVGPGGGVIGGAVPTFDVISGILVTYGVPVTGNLFGELRPRNVIAQIFADLNGNGAYDYTEVGIEDGAVELTGVTYRGAFVSTTLLTDYSGYASFFSVAPGVYTLTEAQPMAWADGLDSVTDGGIVGNDVVTGIVLTGVATYADALFGELLPGLSGLVFVDNDANGLYEDEEGIGGVTVWLAGTTEFGAGLWMTTTTDALGHFSFSAPPTGTYALIEQGPAYLLDGYEQVGAGGGITGPIGVDAISAIFFTPTTQSGQLAAAAGNSFAEIAPSSIEGFVFVDADNNQRLSYSGVCPASCDPPIFGVTIILTGTNDAGQSVWMTATTVTGTIEDYSYIGARFVFTPLRPGVYSVIELQPPGYNDGPMEDGYPNPRIGVNRFGDIALIPDTLGGLYNFGEYPPALSGYVYRDTTNDGIFQRYADYPNGESGLNSIGITLTWQTVTGSVGSRTTQTDNRGRYAFTGLVTGTYTITELQPGSYVDGRESIPELPAAVSNDIYARIAYTPGLPGGGFDFGELYPSSFSVIVFHDRNANGANDNSDFGINNITITLTGTTDVGSPVGPIVLNSGLYGYGVTFNNLGPGTYSVIETQPPGGYVDGPSIIGNNFGGIPGVNRIDAITIITQNSYAYGYGFTEQKSGISGFLYQDVNNNRLHDVNENYFPSLVTVALSSTDGGGVFSTTQTGYDGFYLFAGIPAGTYQIASNQLASLLDSFDQPGTIDGLASGVSGTLGSDLISGIVYPALGVGVNYNFADLPVSRIRGTVYQDLNANGAYDSANQPYETGIRYVTVTLTGTDDVGASVSLTRITDISGIFDFNTLRPGLYTLAELQPFDYTDGREQSGYPTPALIANDRFQGITITTAGSDFYGYYFGELLNGLYGYVFRDTHNDGVFSTYYDSGLYSEQVILSGTTVFGQYVYSPTTTDFNGRFVFNRLVSGTYALIEPQPASRLDGIDTPGTLGGITSTLGNGDDLIAGIVITHASYGRDYLFGELDGAQLSGYVFLDLNSDGTKTFSEPGVPSATLTLSGTNDRNQPVVVVTYTNASGLFNFVRLRPGTYTLSETQPSGYLDGLDRNPSGVLSVINDTFPGILVLPGQFYGNYQFGESGGFLSGYVYGDRNNDGVKGAGESGINNVTVYLTGTRSDTGATVGRVAQTDSAGVYQFVNVLNGVYTLTEIQPAAWFDGRESLGTGAGGVISGNDRFISITMTGPGGSNYNFGEIGPSTFAGNVFFDLYDNGVRDPIDPGIGGATLNLRGTDYLSAPIWMTATTSSLGAYSFTNVRAGIYTVTEIQPADYLDGKDKVGCCGGGSLGNDAIYSVTLKGEDYVANYDFGERISGLSGYVYRDTNNDGLRANASGVGNASITLYGLTSLGVLMTRTATTDGYGFYYFNGLLTGTYSLSETQPAALLDGLDTPGNLGGESTQDDTISNITFQPGQVGSEYNFGEFYGASVGGMVFWDINNDGQLQGGEAGIVGATVALSGTNDLGLPLRITTTTGGDGSFGFAALRPGNYSLVEVQPGNYTDGIDTPGNRGGNADGFDTINGIGLTPESAGSGYLFGERQVGLTGYVYRDLNNDGARQIATEFGIPNTLVELDGTTSMGGPVYRNAVTNQFGFYAFGDLVAGTYRLSAYQPSGFLDGKEGLGTLGGMQGQDTFTITYGTGQYGSEYDFGELPPATLAGEVYLDIDGSGSRQQNEPGLPGVLIGLTGADDRGASVSRASQTNGAGAYTFGSLRPGAYTLAEIQPAGYTDGQDTLGNLGGSFIPSDTFAGIVLGVAGNGYNYNFGETQTGLGGFVYVDADVDGEHDAGETTLFGVTLILTGAPAGGDPITRTAQTDGFGFYRFGDLEPGVYRIREIQPPNYLDGADNAGPMGGSVGPLGQDYIDVAYPGGSFGQNNNFGEYLPNTLRGYVFFDVIDNGVYERPYCLDAPFCQTANHSPEVGIGGGIKIVLTGRNDLSQTVLATDTTNSAGQFSFPLLRPGSYTLTEIHRDVDVDGLDTSVAAPEAIVTNDQVRAISLTIGQTKGAVFGEKPSITGYVYRDDSDNGQREPSLPTLCNSPELGISGVSLQLTGVDVYNTNVTLGAASFSPVYPVSNHCYDGFYYWGGLVTGTYAVHEFQPAGYLDGQETIGTGGGLTTTNDIISRIVFTPGVVITGYNFGEQRNIIAGNVYLDTNGNGLRDGPDRSLDTPATIVLSGFNNLGQPVVMTQTSAGSYQFSGLRPGTYTLTEIQPAGYSDGQEQLGVGAGGALGANDQFVNLVLAPGAYANDYNFGELINANLGGRVAYVWYPTQNAPYGIGLVSETVRMVGVPNAGGSIAMTTTTDASGYYRFLNLPPGAYTVTHVSFPLGYRDFGATVCSAGAVVQGRSIGGIALQYGTNLPYCDFLLGPTLTGYVFADDNANGAKNPGEGGIGGAAVSLHGVLSNGSQTTRSLWTDGSGFFAFGGLLTGTYRLVEAQPQDFYDGNDVAGSLGGLTGTAALSALPAWSTPITNDIIAGIVYTPNALGQNHLFAELRPARLRGNVYYDKDDTGTFTPPFAGLDEIIYPVRVTLEGTNDLGEPVYMTNTGASGSFDFTGLRPGIYSLTETQPPDYTDGIENVGSKGGVLGYDQFRRINLTWGDDAVDYNFGERKFGIVGTVFADRNNNGIFESPFGPDSGIGGVLVWLSGTTAIGDPVVLTFTTGGGGYFNFPDLQPGVYTLSETQPAGYADGLDALGTLGGLLSNDRITGIVIGEHSFGQAYTFGELPPSTLSGYVYVDANNDGYRGGYGEPGIAGVTITLQGQNTLGDPVLMLTRTDPLGYYIFRDIPNGGYSLLESQPNFVDGIDRAGTGAGGVALNDLIIGIGFNMIIDAYDYNFGERPSALSGHVFWDENGNGTREISETGLSPATLKLRGFDFNSQPVNKTTRTTFEGYYAFEALPGTYWIEEVQPFGYLNGLALPGTLGGVISGANVITSIVIGIGGAGSDYDFAEVAPSAVDLAGAMGLDLAFLQSASMQTDLVNKAGVGSPLPGAATLAGFPTNGPTFAYLGTGNMLFADQPNSGPNTFGLGDYARLALTFTVPTTATCLSIDFAFFSEEFPEFVGSQFNDTFDAFVDGQPIARDQNGNRISINSVFGAAPGNAAGTTYDAATPRLRARAELTPGATSVITFFVTDVSDTAYDSAVFIDRFTFGRPEGEACVPGANLPVGVVLTKTVGPWPTAGNPVCALTDALTITQPTEIAYCYRATNTGEYTLTTHTLVDSAFGPLFSQMPLELLPGETFEFITSRVETQTAVSVGTWTGAYSGTFSAASSDVTTVTMTGPVITPTPAPGSATMMILPGSAQTYFTQPITVAVMISGVSNLGGYEVALRFDPAQVTVTHVSQGSFLTTTGRGLVLVPTRFGPDYARFGASTVGAAAGPSGSGALAWVRIAPRESGTATLTLSNTLATNVAGLSIDLTAFGGQLVVIHPGAAYLPRVLR